MPNRDAVVFGGAGFIGCHFLRRLAASGRYAQLYSVDIVEPRFTDPGIRYLNFDVRNPIPSQLCGEALSISSILLPSTRRRVMKIGNTTRPTSTARQMFASLQALLVPTICSLPAP